MTKEIRKSLNIQLKNADLTAEGGIIKGYASVFNGVDHVGDTIVPGAFADVIKEERKPLMLLNHDRRLLPIGKWTVLREDEKGLYVEGELTLDLPIARDVYTALKAGTLDGLSISFSLKHTDYKFNDETGGFYIEHISNLWEISVVTFPCDDSARISDVKSLDIDSIKTIRDLETALREAGLSRNEACAFIARAKAVIADDGDRQRAKAAKSSLLAEIEAKALKLNH